MLGPLRGHLAPLAAVLATLAALLATGVPPSGLPADAQGTPAPSSTPGTPPAVVVAPPTTPGTPSAPTSARRRNVPAGAPFREAPLSELAPEAVALAGRTGGRMGVAVVVPARRTIYTHQGGERFHMASIVKVIILLATLDRAALEDRPLTLDEREWLEPMITWSDNDSADVLWWRLQGASGAAAFLERHGLTGFEMDAEGYWGDSWASPVAVAKLLAALVWGDLLPAAEQAYAMSLLQRVTPSQRWGATGSSTASPQDVVGVKDGWYPEEEGWEVNSAGYVLPAGPGAAYAVAILSDQQDDFDETVAVIEAAGSAVRRALRSG